MRILTISNCELEETQGSGYVITNFARGLQTRGHAVRVFGPRDCLLFPRVSKGRSLRLAFGIWLKALRLISTFRPDIVEFYGGEAWLATSRLSRQAHRGFRMVAHSNGLEPLVNEVLERSNLHNTAQGKPPRWYQRRLRYPGHHAFTKVDAIVTVSKTEAAYAVKHGYQTPPRVVSIENALSDGFLSQSFNTERPNTIGFCGSWLARKGTELIATDLAKVLRRWPAWRLHLVGVGKEFDSKSVFPADVVSRVIVTPFVREKTALRTIYHSWAISLMPSFYESFGLVAAESMSCGCALVANRTGFAASLESEREALLLSKPESPLLYECIDRLIRDPALRLNLAKNGWDRVQCLRWDKSVDTLEAFYRELLKQ